MMYYCKKIYNRIRANAELTQSERGPHETEFRISIIESPVPPLIGMLLTNKYLG